MQRMVLLLILVVLVGSIWALQMDPVMGKGPVTTQENFDLKQFTGRWFEIAAVSTCPHYMQRKQRNPIIVVLELNHVPPQDNFTMTASTFSNGTCRETLTDFSLTSTPGRFFHHVSRFGADVDSFVVHTNYNEYALLLQLSTEKPSRNQTTIVKLYSRTVSVNLPVLEKFKELIRHHGLSEEAIIINQHEGNCFPPEQWKEAATSHQVFVHENSKLNISAKEKQGDV
ncbi:protein AMBP-like isoform X1 [Cyprinodon tularosa]|uniref:protein AMBP-like isoform X1 n=2 Tax=Cyprinodon tularosa TaxID=77115 RepID=UPI0018E25EEE|nr:protein AMBP-like isoform X1 [Cyprinodon tularosa]